MDKVCNKCGSNGPFGILADGYNKYCKKCINQRSKKSYTKNREKILQAYSPSKNREWRLKHEYGLTLEDWEKLFQKQGRVCAICKRSTVDSSKGWHTDHDHTTKVVRGILCLKCNTTVGRLGDNKEKAQALVKTILEYLS